ncbi:hypothetical protein AGMMS50218_16640 [Actinomycetota bacterium]|nr:hypothetical protein AGMMS50218_16640 [Actinomycetota bacterium]
MTHLSPVQAVVPSSAITDMLAALVGHLPGGWAGVVAVLAVVVTLSGRGGRRGGWYPVRRDPLRWFTPAQRAAGRSRAGGRCEYPARWTPWRRCPARAVECDHFVPWSRGGATTVKNLVAACRWHNQAKGAREPSALTAWVITWRRARYFPPDAPRYPGARYRPLLTWADKARR